MTRQSLTLLMAPADDEQRKRLKGLGSMFYEPIWLLVSAGAAVPPLNQVAGTRIGIGP